MSRIARRFVDQPVLAAEGVRGEIRDPRTPCASAPRIEEVHQRCADENSARKRQKLRHEA
ncbi:MAG TPA: hypothetical protein VNO30_34160 [Kofleriaceae bacterium]|nr:hypothetical protein [Kofleriaceae bacterium]